MKLTLNRRPSVGGATIGELLEDGARLCFTLEDEIREQPGVPVGAAREKTADSLGCLDGLYIGIHCGLVALPIDVRIAEPNGGIVVSTPGVQSFTAALPWKRHRQA